MSNNYRPLNLKNPKHAKHLTSYMSDKMQPWKVTFAVEHTANSVPLPYDVFVRGKDRHSVGMLAYKIFIALEKVNRGYAEELLYPRIVRVSGEIGSNGKIKNGVGVGMVEKLSEQQWESFWRAAKKDPKAWAKSYNDTATHFVYYPEGHYNGPLLHSKTLIVPESKTLIHDDAS